MSGIDAALTAALQPVLPDQVWRDEVPEGVPVVWPHATLTGPASVTVRLEGNGGEVLARGHLFTVHLWQLREGEDTALIDQVVTALHRHKPATGPHTWRIGVESWQRIRDPADTDVIHHPITVRVTAR